LSTRGPSDIRCPRRDGGVPQKGAQLMSGSSGRTMRAWRRAIAVTAVAAAVTGTVVTAPAHAATGDRAWTSGLNSDGQLGLGTNTNRKTFAAVPSLTDVDDVHGGREHALAL